ncbi:MAG: hypothetical protein EOO38_20990, partial [Cytophagaceae bacterium]
MPDLPRGRSFVLGLLSMTSLAAWLQYRRVACLAGAATLVAGISEGSISLTAAGSVAALFASGAIGYNLPDGSRQKLLVGWLQMLALVSFSQRLIPGFARTVWPQALQIRPDAISFMPSYNLDKVLAASVVLTFCAVPRASGAGLSDNLRAIIKVTGPTLGLIALMLLPSLATRHVRFDPVLHPYFIFWFVHNLLLVAVPEETLYRGILPLLLERTLPKNLAHPW